MLPIPLVTLALGTAVLAVALASFAAAPRGGRFRGLPGWVGFWALFAPLLLLLSRAHPFLSLPLLGVLMFVALREYFFLAPLRPRDRWVILAAYLSIPLALWPGFHGSRALFFAGVPMVLFVLIPVLLALAHPQTGLFESAGRVLVGVIAFVFCAAHLGLMVRGFDHGEIELFGILVLASELPQRLLGRVKPGVDLVRPVLGIAAGVGIASALGAALGPLSELARPQGALVGLAVSLGSSAGAFLAEGMAQELNLGGATSRFGRGAFLDRTFPAVYAAPVFFHCITIMASR